MLVTWLVMFICKLGRESHLRLFDEESYLRLLSWRNLCTEASSLRNRLNACHKIRKCRNLPHQINLNGSLFERLFWMTDSSWLFWKLGDNYVTFRDLSPTSKSCHQHILSPTSVTHTWLLNIIFTKRKIT